MKFFSKIFWWVLPLAIAVGTYREANAKVRRYWAFSQEREAVVETTKDLNRIVMLLATNYRVTHALPPDLKQFIEQMPVLGNDTRTRPVNVDAWNTPYELRDLEGRYELVSCGPDRDCETAYDNLVEGAVKVNTPAAAAGSGDKTGKLIKSAELMQKNVEEHNKLLEETP